MAEKSSEPVTQFVSPEQLTAIEREVLAASGVDITDGVPSDLQDQLLAGVTSAAAITQAKSAAATADDPSLAFMTPEGAQAVREALLGSAGSPPTQWRAEDFEKEYEMPSTVVADSVAEHVPVPVGAVQTDATVTPTAQPTARQPAELFTADDMEQYVTAVISGTSFRKDYTVMGGLVTFTFKTLSVAEVDAIAHQLAYDREAPLVVMQAEASQSAESAKKALDQLARLRIIDQREEDALRRGYGLPFQCCRVVVRSKSKQEVRWTAPDLGSELRVASTSAAMVRSDFIRRIGPVLYDTLSGYQYDFGMLIVAMRVRLNDPAFTVPAV